MSVMPDTIEDVAFIDSSRKAAASSCTFIPADFPTCIEVESIDTEPKSVVLPLMSNKPSMQLMRDTSSTSTVDKVMLLQVTPTSKPAAFSEQALLICASAPRAYVAVCLIVNFSVSLFVAHFRFFRRVLNHAYFSHLRCTTAYDTAQPYAFICWFLWPFRWRRIVFWSSTGITV